MPAATNPNRRQDIAAALKSAKKDDLLPLGALAVVWGVHKSRFVSIYPTIPGWPQPIVQGTVHLYPARVALKAMLDHETRHDAAAAHRQSRQEAILGGIKRDRVDAKTQPSIPVRDLVQLNRLAAEAEERERAQRLYIPAAEVALVASDVFSELSEFMAGLSNKVDPNGLLDPGLRAEIDQHGSDALLRFHKRMKHILDADADPGDHRGTPDPARKPRARRKRA